MAQPLKHRQSDTANSVNCNRLINKYVGPPNCRAEMYADRIACCPLVSHVEYEPRSIKVKKDGTDGRTPGG